jgi:gluconokinase
MSPMTKLLWFAQEDPGLLTGARWWAGLKDVVLLHLTGRTVTELSSASATGLLDLATRDWDPAVLDLVGVGVEQLPPVLATTEVLGLSPAAAGRLGLRTGLPVVAGAADGPLANLGSGAVAPGVAGLSLGTSGAVRAVVPRPQVDEGGRLFCYALTADAWVVGGAVSNGGVVTKWAVDTFGHPGLRASGEGDDSAEERVMDLAATAPPGSAGLVMLPYLLAERAPLWDPDLPGAYLGLRREHGPAHLVRAAVEGVALQLAAVTAEVHRVHPVHEVRATGGAFRSSLWRDVVAAALDRPMVLAAEAEGTALGCVALALLALGRVDDLGAAVQELGPHAPPTRPCARPGAGRGARPGRGAAPGAGAGPGPGRRAVRLRPRQRGSRGVRPTGG